VIIHAVFIVVALTFVAVQVYVKPEQTFEAKDVKRPQMKLRKLQVPVKEQKKSQAPKLRKTIVTKTKTNIDIAMPEIVGIKGGTGYGTGGGLGGLGFGFDMDLFGSSRRSGAEGGGNEFVGTFYDLKQTPTGEKTKLGELFATEGAYGPAEDAACELISSFFSSGWDPRRFDGCFKAPKLKYATAFMMPAMDASAAPKAFGVADQVEPNYWLCHYKGQIAAPETGRYRFCGIGDDVLAVRVKGKLVMDACWPNKIGRLTNWESDDDNNRKYPSIAPNTVEGWYYTDSKMVIGDWFTLRKGEPVDVEILIGEMPGGSFTAQLLIEQKDKEYKMAPYDEGERPVLPIFKTIPIDEKLLPMMRIDPDIETPKGPDFSVLKNAASK